MSTGRRVVARVALLGASARPRPHGGPPPAARVLLPTTMGYGNMVLLLPALAMLRSALPELRCLLVADRRTDAWQVFDLDAPWIETLWTDSRRLGARGTLSLIRRVRAWRPHVALLNANTSAEPLWAAVARWSGALWRAGHTTGGDFVNPFSAHYNVPVPPVAGHDEVAQNLALVDALCGAPRRPDAGTARPWWSADDAHAAARAVAPARDAGRVVVGLHLTSSPTQPWKRWPPAHFAALAEQLLADQAVALVLLGAPDDRDAVEPFPVFRSPRVVDLVGRTATMRAGAAVVAALDLLVCGDTGFMQTAAAVGVPSVAVYGPTDWTRTLPRGANVRRVSRDEPCAPCFYRTTQGNPARCPHRRCLEALEPARVHLAVRQTLEDTRGRR